MTNNDQTQQGRWRGEEGCRCLTTRAFTDPDHYCPPDPLVHLDGIPWHDARPHAPWRRCKPQTVGLGVERCTCGAIRRAGARWWMERRVLKNSINYLTRSGQK